MSLAEISAQTKIDQLVAELPIAAEVMRAFGLGCSGCGVSKYETLEEGARAHGIRIEPVLDALRRARASGVVPSIAEADRLPQRRAPGAFHGRATIAHVVPVMSGKGGVGKSLVTALLAIGLRRKHRRVGILDADITGPSIPKLFGSARAACDCCRSAEEDAAGAAAAADYARSLAKRDRNRERKPADRSRRHRDDLARTDRRRRHSPVLRTSAVERSRRSARRPAARHVGCPADRRAVALDRRRRSRYDAAGARNDDRAQSG